MSALHVMFIDELTVAGPGEMITFGRNADITLDEANPYMHRIVGAFFHQDTVWWLANKSAHASLTMVGNTGKLARIPPDTVSALAEADGVVRFDFGPSTYEIAWAQPDVVPRTGPPIDTELIQAGDATTQFGVVLLNDEQRLMLLAIAEKQLRDPTTPNTDLPSNASVAHRLGWSGKKLDRKLDYLCARLDALGVRGLRGGKGVEAVDRRARLVEHVISSGLIRPEELELLPE